MKEKKGPYTLSPAHDGEGGIVPNKNYVLFNNQSTHGFYKKNISDTDTINMFNELSISEQEFIDKANSLFHKYKIKIPKDYPKYCDVSDGYFEEFYNMKPKEEPWNEFNLCVYCCILLEEKYDIKSLKILKNELITPNNRNDIYHACTIAIVTLHYLRRGHLVELPKESKNQKNCDLIIDEIKCDVKSINQFDWSKEALSKNREHFIKTGQGLEHNLSEDICFDVGEFIKNRGFNGIKQADLIFVNLSKKSLGTLFRIESIKKIDLPKLKKYRIIFFSNYLLELNGFHIDFSGTIWNYIKENDRKHRYGIHPPP
jgi:hypothetical protein